MQKMLSQAENSIQNRKIIVPDGNSEVFCVVTEVILEVNKYYLFVI